MFEKIEKFIDDVKALFAKIGETNFFQTILGALSKILKLEKEDETAEIVDAIAGTIE